MFSILNNLSCDLWTARWRWHANCHQTTTFSGGFMDQTLVLHVIQEVIKHWTAGYVYSAKAKYSDLCFSVRVGVYICMCNDNKFTTWGTLSFFITLASLLSLREFSLFSVLVWNIQDELCISTQLKPWSLRLQDDLSPRQDKFRIVASERYA